MIDTKRTDDALEAFTLVAGMLGIAVNADDLRHRHATGENGFGPEEMVRAARALGLKARIVTTGWERLIRTPMPALAILKDGRVWAVGRTSDNQALIQDPAAAGPENVDRERFDAAWSGRLILLARRAGASRATGRFGIGWFLPAVYRYRHVLGEVLAASFFLQILALISPLFFQVVIDKVLVHRGISTLNLLMVGMGAVAVFELLLGTLRTYVFSHTTNRIDVELGARLFDHLLALPMAYFSQRRVGDSVARVRELENIRNFITGSALTLVLDLLFTVVFLAVMFIYSPLLTWVVIGSLPVFVAISLWVSPIFQLRLADKFARGAENQAFLVESVTGIETLKAMAVEPQMQRRWEEQLAAYIRASFATQNLANYASQAVQMVNKLTIVITLWLGAHAVIDNDLTVGELVAFTMLSARVASPVLRIAQLWQDFQQVRVSIDRLGDILNTPRDMAAEGAASLPPIKGRIQFEHVNFRYRVDGSPVLNDVSLDIRPGEVIGVVGPSGSGKSTLAKLVQRLYVPESGRIFVDGVDLALVDISWLRRQIGIVLQENILFNRSVRDNIALSDPAMPMARIIAAAELAGAHDFILELPQGYDTVIGERGASLSGGQRQRVAIARALVTDPRILIFDEATSALDTESERAIQDNLSRLTSGRTCVVIAHRLSTIRDADTIIVLERGKVAEMGNHDQLMAERGLYFYLSSQQLGI
jgi:subfamily B ATP-binding cassette protein HlyB/CyaB